MHGAATHLGVLVAGLAGGLSAGVITYYVPELDRLARDPSYRFTRRALVSKIPVTLVLSALASLFAYYAGPADMPHAFYFGLAIQSAFKGVFATVKEITAPPGG